MADWIIPLATFQEQIVLSQRPSWQGFSHGTMRTYLFSPGGRDLRTLQSQVETNHSQDEIYIAIRGRCTLSKNGELGEITEGDVVFVEAGATHQFEGFSEDFAAWVIFWGPPGGER